MTETELQTALEKFAKSDLAMARREEAVLITQTKSGLVKLSYDPSNRTYSARSQGLNSVELFVNAKAKEATSKLAALYDVQQG